MGKQKKNSIIWKIWGRRAKPSELWNSGPVVEHYMGYRCPCTIQGHSGVIRCTCDFSVNMIFITLPLLQIADEIWSLQNCLGFWKFSELKIFNDF